MCVSHTCVHSHFPTHIFSLTGFSRTFLLTFSLTDSRTLGSHMNSLHIGFSHFVFHPHRRFFSHINCAFSHFFSHNFTHIVSHIFPHIVHSQILTHFILSICFFCAFLIFCIHEKQIGESGIFCILGKSVYQI